MAVFHKFINTPTAIKDVEFDLFNVNGFDSNGLIPGASSYHYRYVVRLDSSDVDAWIDFLAQLPLDTSLLWQDSLISERKEQWKIRSSPLYFKWKVPENSPLFETVYKPEGMVFREVINN